MLNVHLIEPLVGLLYTESRAWAKNVKQSSVCVHWFNLLFASLRQEEQYSQWQVCSEVLSVLFSFLSTNYSRLSNWPHFLQLFRNFSLL